MAPEDDADLGQDSDLEIDAEEEVDALEASGEYADGLDEDDA